MNIGIIGSGRIGGTVGRLWACEGHQVLFNYSRNTANLKALAAAVDSRARAGTPAEAARFGEVVLFSPPWMLVDDALREAGSLARYQEPNGSLCAKQLHEAEAYTLLDTIRRS